MLSSKSVLWIKYLSFFKYIYMNIFLYYHSDYLSICLTIYQPKYLTIYLPNCLSNLLSIYLTIYLPISIYSIYLTNYLSTYPTTYLFNHVSKFVVYFRVKTTPSSVLCHAEETRATPSRTSPLRKGQGTGALASQWWGARTPPRGLLVSM